MDILYIFVVCLLIRFGKSHDVDNCRYVTIPVCGDKPVSNLLVPGAENIAMRGPSGPPKKAGQRGSVGIKGQKGERGFAGAKGDSPGALDIETIVSRKVQESGADFCRETETAGIYLVYGEEFVCDGSGWTIIQRRRDGSVNFEKNWSDYVDGFGSLDGEFWFGLRKMHKLIRNRDCQLKIELESFNREQAYAHYKSFVLADEEKKFRLTTSGYSGTAGDSMSFSDGMMFTTKDADNDIHASNCAGGYGGWWFKNCFRASLNAPWGRSTGRWKNIIWYSWKGESEALNESTMKIQCV